MAKQFSILTTDIDLQALESILGHAGDTDIFSDEPTDDLCGLVPVTSLALPPEEAGKFSLFCYLAPRHLPPKIFIERESSVKVHVDHRASNLVELWRPFFDGKILRPGRVYLQDQHWINNELKLKDLVFCEWAKKTMSAIRRSLRYDPSIGTYLGADAAAAIASGRVKVASI